MLIMFHSINRGEIMCKDKIRNFLIYHVVAIIMVPLFITFLLKGFSTIDLSDDENQNSVDEEQAVMITVCNNI